MVTVEDMSVVEDAYIYNKISLVRCLLFNTLNFLNNGSECALYLLSITEVPCFESSLFFYVYSPCHNTISNVR